MPEFNLSCLLNTPENGISNKFSVPGSELTSRSITDYDTLLCNYVNFVNQDSDSVSIFAQELRTKMFATESEQN